MASLKDLIVTGPARFLDKLYGNLEGNATTANQWSTARTFTIGNKGWKVSGDNDVTWTHAEIGAIVSNAWDAGTTAGPKIKTTVNGVTGTAVAIPSASISASGIVTTALQRFRGKKLFEYPAFTSNDSRYLGWHYYHPNGSTTVGEHWYDIGTNTNITTGIFNWRQYSPNSTANTSTTGYYETFYLPPVTVGRTAHATYEIFTSKNYTTLDDRYVNVSGDTMTGDLKFTNKGLHFVTGDADQYLWKVYGSTDGSFGFRLQYNGTGTGNNNSLSLIADNQQGAEVNAFTMLQDGTIILTVNPQFKTTNYTSTPISLIDDGTNYGHTMLIGAGGTTYIGAGESASGLYSKLAVKSTEDLILGADSNIRFYTNADNATATSGITLNTSNHFYPQTTSTGSIGTSGNKWKEAYFSDTVTAGKGFTVDGTMTFYPEKSNEINFGGTNNSTTIYIGYRATDSRPVPTKFIFGSSGGTASLQCNTVYLGSGTSSYVSSTQYTGNAASASWLNTNSALVYGSSGLQYFNLSGTAGTDPKTNNTPTSDWYHILRMNHSNNSGYFADIAVPLNNTNGIYWRQIRYGTNYGWYTLLDSNNYTSYTVKKDGTGASGTWGINITGSAGSVAWGNVSGKPSFNYLPLAGGTMNAGSQIIRGGQSKSWISGRDGALLRINTLSGYSPAISIKTNNGTWDIGAYDNSNYTDKLIFSFATDANYNAGTNSTVQYMIDKNGYFNGTCSYASSAGSANSVAWGNVSGKPSTFAPSSHTHSYLPLSGGTVTGAISITTNGVTNSFYSQNSSYTHYSTNASVGHWFNKSVYVQGEIYAGSSYNKRVYHMGNIVYGSEPANPVDRMIWLYPA